MAIVYEKHNPAANRPTQVDPKTGKPLPATAIPPRAASPGLEGLEASSGGGFFGSFFKGGNKKKMASMEAPPPTLKASSTLSDKESQEVEVISKSTLLLTAI
jgi:vacuolar protein sorting-associated protein 1